jgi:quercetin dioxygenase-like cupin family protein
VELLRFDSSTGWRIGDGSDFVQSPLTPPGGTVKAACFHLPAGGGVVFHEATIRQLFCVVAGSGWVTGADRARVPIAAFEAVFWEAGEWHEAGSDEGLSAVVLEGDVEPYRPTA